ncbi:MAG: glycosyltransferase family 4 protein [Fimbriimonadales bacterium]
MSATTLLEKPSVAPLPTASSEATPVLVVVRPSSSGMLRHVQGLIKYLPEHGFLPTLTGPDFIRDRPGPIADSRAVKTLRAYARDFPLVHCHGVRAGWICALALRNETPWLWTVHHLLMSESRLVRLLWRWIAKHPRVIMAVSDSVKEGMVRGGLDAERIEVVHGGIDLERFENLPDRVAMRIQFHTPRERPVVLCVGRFVRHKGFDLAIRAMEHVWQVFPDADIWLAGDGIDNKHLVSLSLASSKTHHIRFFGYWSAVEELYSTADVLVAPARDAGLGLAVMEAMACGLPVVVSDIPQLQALVKHEQTGLIVPREDVESLGQAIIRILQDRKQAQAMARNARLQSDRFHIRHTVERTVPFYRSVLGKL